MWNIILRGWNWCTRFRHRCGYGVHSPSDFYLITFVAYEYLPYYAYSELSEKRKPLQIYPHYREKVDKLLFRLVNYLHPPKIWEFGTGSGIATRYMAAACNVPIITWSAESLPAGVESLLSECAQIHTVTGCFTMAWEQCFQQQCFAGMVHIAHTPNYKEVYESVLPLMQPASCLIIASPYASEEKRCWWKQVIADPRTGVTFDFYDFGLVFFDPKRVKEHRIVNFL